MQAHVDEQAAIARAMILRDPLPVSYTHLDVYKRQPHDNSHHSGRERKERLMGVAAEIDHVEDGLRNS